MQAVRPAQRDGTVSGVAGPGQPVGGRVMGTGTCIALIVIGAILRFAVTATRTHGVNVHVVGVIVLLAGVLGLLLSLLVWSPLNPNRRRAARSAYDGTRPVPEQPADRRMYRDDPPVQEHRAYTDEPPR
jgi:hypothetical protein